MMPISPSNITARVAGDSSAVDDDTEDDQADTGDDLDNGQDEFHWRHRINKTRNPKLYVTHSLIMTGISHLLRTHALRKFER